MNGNNGMRYHVVSVRLTDQQTVALLSIGKKLRMTTSEVIRRALDATVFAERCDDVADSVAEAIHGVTVNDHQLRGLF